jgi:hypothetical protein
MTTKKQATKLDRKTTARVDAMVIRCADAKVKESCQSLIGVLAEKGITVTFDQLEWSVQKLGLKWRDVFLPATRLERGYAGPPGSKTQEPASGPDMQAVLDRIEQLEQTLTTSGLAEYRGLHRQAHKQAQLAKDKALAIQADVKKTLEWTQTLASVASKVSRMENWLFKVLLHVVPQTDLSEKEEAQQ